MKAARVLHIPQPGLPSILDHMATLADPVRSRMLVVLERHELTVSELCTVLVLPQSTVSRHLKALADGGWVASRRHGTSRYYAMAAADLDDAAARLWPLIREQVAETAGAGQDERRVAGVLARRRSTSQQFFSSASGAWDRLRRELFGDVCYLQALPGLLDPDMVVGDLGCGTGQMSALLAPYVAKVVAVDASADMLRAARRRLEGAGNVDFREGDLEALPLADGEIDAAVLALVLHHIADPARALAEAGRALGPRGRLLVLDMLPHEHSEYQQQMGHVWLGFSEADMRRLVSAAGLTDLRLHMLPVAEGAKGPALFAATCVRATNASPSF